MVRCCDCVLKKYASGKQPLFCMVNEESSNTADISIHHFARLTGKTSSLLITDEKLVDSQTAAHSENFSFRAKLYECPDSVSQRVAQVTSLFGRVAEIKSVIEQTGEHRDTVLRATACKAREWDIKVRPKLLIFAVLEWPNMSVYCRADSSLVTASRVNVL